MEEMIKKEQEQMKILHIGDIAGVPQELAKAQRKLGHKSDVLSFTKHPFCYDLDYCYMLNARFPMNYIKMIGLVRLINKYDILHFHGHSLKSSGIDIILWKILRKKIIIHHHGSELRYKGEKYIYSKFADKILVSTPDLLEWSPTSVWIPNPIDTSKYKFVEPNLNTHKLRILHAPSDRNIKGTEYVIKATDILKQEGYDFELILLEKMSHEYVIKQIKLSDIIVDQLLIGWYGVFSIESMGMGKPVLCYIKKNLSEKHTELPILSTTPKSVYDNLKLLLENSELRIELGIKSRKYVEEMNDSNNIAKKLLEMYTN
ncbi:glycosyltransferase family 4 protein [Methanococcoides sp. SA1]|nr:glycosyltransferase family 4 protein [Methanococcoides sp. SA1]